MLLTVFKHTKEEVTVNLSTLINGNFPRKYYFWSG